MKAAFYEEHGQIEQIKIGELPRPKPLPGEALVKVHACALNHLDLWILRGWPGLKLQFPHIPGADIAGEIVEVTGSPDWKVGDRVVVSPGFPGTDDEWLARGEECLSPNYQIFGENRPGGLAEFISVPITTLARLSDHLSFAEGCAPLLVGITALRMLRTRAQLRAGETALIVGSGGGVNSISIQLAKHFGAHVIVLAGDAQKMAAAKKLGADEVINYREHPEWSREVKQLTKGRGADVVVDNVGSPTIEQSLRAAARGGRIVTVGNTRGPILQIDNRLIFTKQLSLLGSTMGNRAEFEEIVELVRSKKIHSVIDSTYPLEQTRKAFEKIERGEQFGKIVMTMD